MNGRGGIVIGLTGGIASGKSTVSDTLCHLGARVLDADTYAREAVAPGTSCYTKILETFGCQVRGDGDTISRKALAAAVFSDAHKREALNAIIHPYVLQRLMEETQAARLQSVATVVWDVPLLLEVGWQQYTDCVLLVAADENTRVRRIMKRDGSTPEEARLRIRAQMTDAEKCAMANFVLVNQSSVDRLKERVEQVYRCICSKEWEGE